MRSLLVLPLLAGCLSLSGGPRVNAAITDTPVRRAGSSYRIGTYSQFVENRVIGQLFYGRDYGPLGGISSRGVQTVGLRMTTAPGGNGFGWYGMTAYGRNFADSPEGSAFSLAGGLAYSMFHKTGSVRSWASGSLGLVYHRQHQETIQLDEPGHFLGLELTVSAGFDILGPLTTETPDDE